MTAQNKGIFEIAFNDANEPEIIFQLVNTEVWLSKQELTELFGIDSLTLTSHLEEIYQSKVFRQDQTSKYHLYTSDDEIKYDITHCNLEIIVALAYRIHTWKAELIRNWFIKKAIKGHYSINYPLSDNSEKHSLN